MKQLLFIILICFTHICTAQKINLVVETKTQKEDSLITKFLPTTQFKTKKELAQSMQSTTDSLLSMGYFTHTFSPIMYFTKDSAKTTFTSGRKISTLRLKKIDSLNTAAIKSITINSDNTYIYIDTQKIPEFLQKLSNLDADKGFPLSSYQLKEITITNDTATAFLSTNKKHPRFIQEIQTKGYSNFPRAFLKHYAKIQTGDVFNRKKINQGTEELDRLSFITITKPAELLFKKDSTSLYLYIDKEHANRFEGFLGFGSQENSTKLRIDGYIDLKLENTLNYGESLNFTFKGNGADQQMLSAKFRMPYVFNSPLSITPGIKLFRQDSTFATNSQSLKADYTLVFNKRVYAQIDFNSSTNLQDDLSTQNYRDFKKTLYSLGFEYRKSEKNKSAFDNDYATIAIGVARRKLESEKQDTQLTFKIEAAHSFNLSKKTQFHFKNNTSFIDSNQLFQNELFRFGGMNTLRGFKENSIFASFYAAIQTEYRYAPVSNFFINTVFDAAYFENKTTPESDLLYSIGFGGSMLTQAGWLSLNLANGLQSGESFRFSKSILHLRLISKF